MVDLLELCQQVLELVDNLRVLTADVNSKPPKLAQEGQKSTIASAKAAAALPSPRRLTRIQGCEYDPLISTVSSEAWNEGKLLVTSRDDSSSRPEKELKRYRVAKDEPCSYTEPQKDHGVTRSPASKLAGLP